MDSNRFVIVLVVLCRCAVVLGLADTDKQLEFNNISSEGNHTAEHGEHRYHVVTVDFQHVQAPFLIALWILLASIAKIGFHLYNKLSSIFPESCMLIILGILVGLILYFANLMDHYVYYLQSKTFFLFLLPPIVLEAGYFMPNRAFFDNIGTILLFAVVGTLFNTLTIGFSLWIIGSEVLGLMKEPVSLLTCLVFSSLISAVDPVAVLAVFEEIHVNEVLFIIVFGESLLNDAVTVVLYHMFEAFAEIKQVGNLIAVDVVSGIASFLIVSIGGTVIGLFYGAATAFITKYTDHVRVIEPIFVFVMAYLAYLTAELFHLSGILAIVFCGICMKPYVQQNLSQKSSTTVKYFMKMLSSVSETVIFMFLGLSTITDVHDFHLLFVIFTLSFCFIYRVLGILLFSWVANRFRLLKLTWVDQFVMAYGGLRGAIAFSLVILLPESTFPEKRMLVTTTIIVIYFTVFIQGITIKPLVNVLQVKKDDKHEIGMNERIHTRLIDHCMAGMEDIIGHFGHHRLRDRFTTINTKYLEPVLLREKPLWRGHQGIYKTYSRLNMKDAIDHISRHGSIVPQSSDARLVDEIMRRGSISSAIGVLTSYNGHGQQHSNNDTVLDMQVLNAHYSRKIADDSKIHHIVEDNLFRPRRKWTSHSRHRVDDVINHPPFHHKLRHHLRHMVSKRAAATATTQTQQGAAHTQQMTDNNDENDDDKKERRRSVSFELLDTQPEGAISRNMEGPENSNSSDSESDAGITFTAKADDDGVNSADVVNNANDEDLDELNNSPPPPTAAETSLPWKRAYIQPPIPSMSHEGALDSAQLAECPSWAANLDYTPEPPHLNGNHQDSSENGDKEEHDFAIPPPWKTTPSDDQPTLPRSMSHDSCDGAVVAEAPRICAGKSICESALPWRSSNASNEAAPMISPSASQVWSHAALGSMDENGQSHHSDPNTGHHHVTANIHDDLTDYHALLHQDTFHHNNHVILDNLTHERDIEDDEEAIMKLQEQRRHPQFLRKGLFLERRPSVTLPIELNREEDNEDRIRKWLQSSHPDSLAFPPDFIVDIQPSHPQQHIDETTI